MVLLLAILIYLLTYHYYSIPVSHMGVTGLTFSFSFSFSFSFRFFDMYGMVWYGMVCMVDRGWN